MNKTKIARRIVGDLSRLSKGELETLATLLPRLAGVGYAMLKGSCESAMEKKIMSETERDEVMNWAGSFVSAVQTSAAGLRKGGADMLELGLEVVGVVEDASEDVLDTISHMLQANVKQTSGFEPWYEIGRAAIVGTGFDAIIKTSKANLTIVLNGAEQAS